MSYLGLMIVSKDKRKKMISNALVKDNSFEHLKFACENHELYNDNQTGTWILRRSPQQFTDNT